jgi:co-chaperonin GroES (HSP10)
MIKAIKNRIFIKKNKLPDQIGSIYIPKTTGKFAPPYLGTIVSIGSTVTDPDYYVGALVAFHDLAGFEFTVDDEIFYSIIEQDIIAVIKDKNIKIF